MNRDGRLRLHRAPWLIPVLAPPIRDGGLAVRDNTICGLAPFGDLRRSFPGAEVIDHPDTVLVPGLVNAHIHLELSHLHHLGKDEPPPSFTGWIGSLLAARRQADRADSAGPAAREAKRQWLGGVALLADIGNTDLGCTLADNFPGVIYSFLEFIGISEDNLMQNISILGRQDEDRMCTAHAPYSTHARLLAALKRRADRFGHCFPIHVAESEAECELVAGGTGEFRDFLVSRGLWDSSFRPTGIDNSGSVQYLQNLGLLDERTICVHCVQVRRQEVDMLAASGAKVCLCPGSNRFLAVGRAPLPWFLEAGILPALGTDSLASNPELSLWREMRLLAEDHPGVEPATILAMATLGGAGALGCADRFGSLLPGRTAAVVAVRLGQPVHRKQEVMEYLVSGVPDDATGWLEETPWPA